ncbi:DUF3240 family protein [Aurantivibrio plasticivorans]
MKSLLVLNTSLELEEDMVDFLLEQDDISGFTSYRVNGHGEAGAWHLVEQVTGRRKRIQFEITLAASLVDKLIDSLSVSVGKDIYFYELPVQREGHLR